MKVNGIIHNVFLHEKLIGIRQQKKIIFFYFQNSQMNLFKRYLYKGIWIELDYDENRMIKKRDKEAYIVSFVYQIRSLGKYNSTIYYDKKMLNQSLSKFLKSLGNIMILDLEMTMPSYNFKGKGFKPEIIQAGFVVINSNINERLSPKLQALHYPISPTKYPFLGKTRFVFCGDLKEISSDVFANRYKCESFGRIEEEDLTLIVEAVVQSGNVSPKRLRKFGLIE